VTSDRAPGLALIEVSSQTEARLDKYVELLALAKSHKPHIRARIFSSLDATSSRLRTVAWLRAARSPVGRPRIRRRVSGEVIAILLAKMKGGAEVHCLESDQSKCAFLREVAHATDAPARIHAARIEMFNPCALSLVDAVASRVLAPLPRLLELANVWLMLGAVGIFPRGRSVAAQTETFSVASQFQFKSFRNCFDPDARIDRVHSRDSRAQAQK
jgi:16S rRNA (guanine527-N7)-methyltransferase